MNRTLELFLSMVAIIIFLPLFFFLSILIFLETRKFPILSQARAVHLGQIPIILYKFRTLHSTGETKKNRNDNDILIKSELAHLVTKSGYWLRRTGLDELPQIFNILIGNMSFIGPRPLTLIDLHNLKKKYPLLYSVRTKLKSKPGISGLWQIYGKRELGIKNLIELDYMYEKNRNLLLDIRLLLKTLRLVLSARNSDAILPDTEIESAYSLANRNSVEDLFEIENTNTL